jgi:uncharacterized protein
MRVVFADAGYWIALANPRDHLHVQASDWSKRLNEYRIVTSELMLAEVLNGLADSGPRTRIAASVHAILDDSNTRVVPQTSQLFRAALGLYRDRPDKGWSLTDCASFLIMDDQKIAEVSTHDRHFEQYGYGALLRDQ